MILTLDNKNSISNPGYSNLRYALIGLLQGNVRLIRLSKSDDEWLEASWDAVVGIRLKSKEIRSANLYHDDEYFVSMRIALTVLNSFAKNEEGWRTIIRWVLGRKSSRKGMLSTIIIGGGIVSFFLGILFLTIYFIQAYSPAFRARVGAFIENEFSIGLCLTLWGIALSLANLKNFVYRNEVEDPFSNQHIVHNYHFGLGLFCCGLMVIIYSMVF